MNWVWIELHGTMTSPAPGGSGRASISPINLGQKRSATRPATTIVTPRVRFSIRLEGSLGGNWILLETGTGYSQRKIRHV